MDPDLEPVRKRRGPAPTGMDPILSFRCPKELIAQIKAFAGSENITLSDAVRHLVKKGLDD